MDFFLNFNYSSFTDTKPDKYIYIFKTTRFKIDGYLLKLLIALDEIKCNLFGDVCVCAHVCHGNIFINLIGFTSWNQVY